MAKRNSRNIAYIKPDEPAFLKRIKQEIGYKEVEEDLEVKVNKLIITRIRRKHLYTTY